MRRVVLSIMLAWSSPLFAQRATDVANLRRALAVDPFAIAPYRLLTTGLLPAERKRLVDELGRSDKFADEVLLARIEVENGQVAIARNALHNASAQLPNDTRTLDAFCQLALSSGAFVEASFASARSLERGRTPARLVTAAIAELRQGKQKEGLALLEEARQKDPSGGATDAALDVLLGRHMADEAATLLHASLDGKSGGGNAMQWRRLADLERQLNHFGAASTALLHALDAEQSPTGRRATSQTILRMYREKHQLPELWKELKGAQTLGRLVLRGDVESEMGKSAAATATWEAAAKVDPADAEPQLHLAHAAKTPAERVQRYSALVAAHPTELRFVLELSDLQFANKDENAGKQTLRDASARFTSSTSAQEQIARRLADHRDLEGALVARRRAADLEPRDPDYAFALADGYRSLKQRPEAVAAYKDGIARAGGGRAAYDRALDACERNGYEPEADAFYLEMRARWPGDLTLIRRNAEALERRGKRESLQTALDLWKEFNRKATTPFDKEQAKYQMDRVDTLVKESR